MDKSLILNEIKLHYGFKKDTDFADYLGITSQVLSNWKTRNTFDYDVIYTKCLNINPHWLFTGEGNMLKNEQVPVNSEVEPIKSDLKGIPLLPMEAFAGFGNSLQEGVSFDMIEERYEVPLFKGIKVDFMIPVKGSSMYPKYNSGDVVASRFIRDLLYIQWNKVYVLDTASQGTILKRLKKSDNPDFVICKSDNKEYDDFEVPKSDIRNIALVVGVIRLE